MASRSRISPLAWVLIGIGLVLATLLILFYAFNDDHDWHEYYEPNVKEPYGGYVLHEILRHSQNDTTIHIVRDTIYTSIDIDTLEANSAYVFLGKRMFLDSLETRFLMDFVEKGHTAYVICKRHNITLLDELMAYKYDLLYLEEEDLGFYENPMSAYADTVIFANFWNPDAEEFEERLDDDFAAIWNQNEETNFHNWRYFKNDIAPTADRQLDRVGYFNDEYLNCVEIEHGDGKFVLHTNPELFTNYFLTDSAGFQYANAMFIDLGEGDILWDEDNRVFQETAGNAQDYGDSDAEAGALSFILGERRLRYAWYTLLLTAFLFLLFGARRNQRVVPVSHQNVNTSIEYSETVGQIYMRQKDHRSLGLLKMKLFLAFIREHYTLKTSTSTKEEDEALVKMISIKSNVKLEHVKSIFTAYNDMLHNIELPTASLVAFHRKLEHFYNHCK